MNLYRSLRLEVLESRRLLAGDLQNPLNALDVDNSGLVTALDALLVINRLSTERRSFSSLDAPQSPPSYFFDVNGNGQITPLDALLIINALNRYPDPVNLVLSVAPEADPNGNGVVLQPLVELLGQTTADAKLSVTIEALDVELNPMPGQRRTVSTTADPSGRFSLDQELFFGLNQLTAVATNPLGRQVTVQREIVWGDLVADWNAAILNVVRDWTDLSDDPYPGRIVPALPPVVARDAAMIHVAIFDALNAVNGEYLSYTDSGAADLEGGASADAAAASAAYQVAMALYPEKREAAVWYATLVESLKTVPDGQAKEAGIDFGGRVAVAVLQSRAGDGSGRVIDFGYDDAAGHWSRTAPDFLPPLIPHWGEVRPMAVSDVTIYRPDAPPPLRSAEYAAAVDEVMRLGRLDSVERTAEQTEIALFWVDGGGTATPPGHWNRIAAYVSLASGENSLDRARTLALLNLALADAGIAAWDTKYAYDLWRPINAIRRAAEDGNSATVSDATWLPLIRTPPFPAYTSGHSTFSGAAAAVLTGLFGENLSFTSRSDGHSGLTQRPLASVKTRGFESFDAAAEEAGLSRIYGGIHYRFDDAEGLAAGRAIGRDVVEHWLLRIAETPFS